MCWWILHTANCFHKICQNACQLQRRHYQVRNSWSLDLAQGENKILRTKLAVSILKHPISPKAKTLQRADGLIPVIFVNSRLPVIRSHLTSKVTWTQIPNTSSPSTLPWETCSQECSSPCFYPHIQLSSSSYLVKYSRFCKLVFQQVQIIFLSPCNGLTFSPHPTQNP